MRPTPHTGSTRSIRRWRTQVLRIGMGASILALLGTTTPTLAQSLDTADTAIARQTCEMYKNTLIDSLRLTEENLQAAMNSARPDERITRRIAQEIRRDVLQGLIDVETDPGLQRILTRAANRFMTTGRLDTYQQELQPLDQACPPVMAQRFEEPEMNTQSSPSPQTRTMRSPEPQRDSANRFSLPESAPLRR